MPLELPQWTGLGMSRRTAQVEVRWSGNKVQEGRLRSFGHCREEGKQKDHKKGGHGQTVKESQRLGMTNN